MDQEIQYLTQEEITAGMSSPDIETKKKFSDGWLSGSIKVKRPEDTEQEPKQAEQPVESTEQPQEAHEATPVDGGTETTGGEVSEESEAARQLQEEIERERRLAETRLQQSQQEWERKLKELEAEKTAELERERKEREELQKRLIEQSAKQQEQAKELSPEPSLEEEDDFASEYSKKTRRMAEELHRNFRPELLTEIQDRLKHFEEYVERKETKENEEKLARKQKEEEERKAREAKELFGKIESFQKAHPELKTEKNVKQLNDEYVQFYRDVAYLIKSNDEATVNRSVYQFFDEHAGKDLRAKAEQAGIRPPAEFEKFQQLAKLVDMANGIEVDPVTGEVKQLTNEFGKPVAYPTLEAAYMAMNPEEVRNNLRREAYKEVNSKIEQRREGAVTLDNSRVADPEVKMSKQEALQYLIQDSTQFRQIPGNMEKLKLAYMVANQPMPKLGR